MLAQLQRPNILFLMTDQHNARCLGHRGHPDVKTPNIDALAAPIGIDMAGSILG